jgi:hypothetical protein
MKSLKISFTILLISVLLIQCTENENYNHKPFNDVTMKRNIFDENYGESCLEDNLPPNIGGCERDFAETIVFLDQYPGCKFFIEFGYYFCEPDQLFVGQFWFGN